jgi:predicted DNA-binding protein (MmcQ/YjbR family)
VSLNVRDADVQAWLFLPIFPKESLTMNLEQIRLFCLSLPEVSEDLPFDENILAFRVCGKIFALLSLNSSPLTINLKCEPSLAVELRERFVCVQPGYHMNKTHWNTVTLDGSAPRAEVQAWVEHSWERVASGLKKDERLAVMALWKAHRQGGGSPGAESEAE